MKKQLMTKFLFLQMNTHLRRILKRGKGTYLKFVAGVIDFGYNYA